MTITNLTGIGPGTEAIDVITGVVAHLKDALTECDGRVFDTLADATVDRYPLCVVSLYDTHDALTSNGTRVLTHVSLQVKVINKAKTYADLRPELLAVDTAMGEITATGHTFGLYRERPIADTVTEAGQQFRQVGGIYRVTVRA